MSSILQKLRDRLATKATSAKEQYAQLIRRSDAPKEGDDELLASIVESLGISLERVARDIETYATYTKLAESAADLEKNREAHKAAHDKLMAFEKRKAAVIADLAAEALVLEGEKSRAWSRMSASDSARAKRTEIERINYGIFAPNTVRFEDAIAE